MATESFFQKEKRLKARKSVYKETYKKGALFIENKDVLIEWIRQKDIIIRVIAAGKLDDGTEFNQLSIEGFNP